jgi:hypothetical protein
MRQNAAALVNEVFLRAALVTVASDHAEPPLLDTFLNSVLYRL